MQLILEQILKFFSNFVKTFLKIPNFAKNFNFSHKNARFPKTDLVNKQTFSQKRKF